MKNEKVVSKVEEKSSKKSHRSPVLSDSVLVVSYDEEGVEIREFKTPDYKSLAMSNGQSSDWSLDSLLKAGINPQGSIHTTVGCRLESLGQLSEFERLADDILKAKDEVTDIPKSDE